MHNTKMKTKIKSTDGKEGKEIVLPKVFDSKIREDVVSKVLEAKKFAQPYAPNLQAGKNYFYHTGIKGSNSIILVLPTFI